MHRSNFRAKKKSTSVATMASGGGSAPDPIFKSIKRQIENLQEELSPLKADVKTLASPTRSMRLDQIDYDLARVEKQLSRMADTFAKALLGMADKVDQMGVDLEAQLKRMGCLSDCLSTIIDKLEGDATIFSLTHALQNLHKTLDSRRVKIIRNDEGDMVAFETDTGTDVRH